MKTRRFVLYSVVIAFAAVSIVYSYSAYAKSYGKFKGMYAECDTTNAHWLFRMHSAKGQFKVQEQLNGDCAETYICAHQPEEDAAKYVYGSIMKIERPAYNAFFTLRTSYNQVSKEAERWEEVILSTFTKEGDFISSDILGEFNDADFLYMVSNKGDAKEDPKGLKIDIRTTKSTHVGDSIVGLLFEKWVRIDEYGYIHTVRSIYSGQQNEEHKEAKNNNKEAAKLSPRALRIVKAYETYVANNTSREAQQEFFDAMPWNAFDLYAIYKYTDCYDADNTMFVQKDTHFKAFQSLSLIDKNVFCRKIISWGIDASIQPYMNMPNTAANGMLHEVITKTFDENSDIAFSELSKMKQGFVMRFWMNFFDISFPETINNYMQNKHDAYAERYKNSYPQVVEAMTDAYECSFSGRQDYEPFEYFK